MAQKPIDIISKRLSGDILKYQHGIMCDIMGVKSYKAVGMVLTVSPIQDVTLLPSDVGVKEDREIIYVTCINRLPRFWEHNLEKKYYCLVLDLVKDDPSNCFGFLVPKTTVGDVKEFIKGEELESEQDDLILDKGKM